ncbi:MAG: nuclear transport factor 2 family protein [Cyclobacteriaceae bacterium]|nr:nuclear transport factor 2 family protein [Cyclobacteriaceae bacterium]
MRTLLLILFVAGTLVLRAQTPTDREQVYAAIEDYVDALYLVQPDRIKQSVHPNLTKKGFWRQPDKTTYEKEATMTFDQLFDLAGRWNAKGTLPKDAPRIIEVFDVLDQTATAKLTAHWGIDYFQLAKYDGKWLIVNIIWQAHPPKGS